LNNLLSSIIKKPIVLIFILSIIVVILFLITNNKRSSVKGSNNTEEKNVTELLVNVMAKPVVFTADNRTFEAVGTGRARQSVEIYPVVAEEVTDVLFKAQDSVSKGDVLVQLDDREEDLALKLAEVKLKDAKRLLDRYEQAVKEGAVPQSEVDSARADVDSAQVALEQAKLALEERKVIAPFSGVVGIPRIDPGDRVTTGTFITGLDDRKIIYVDFEVPEKLVGSLSEENTITATTSAYPEKSFTGRVTALESRVDSESRTVMVRASIDNTEDLLRPGMSFTTRLELMGNDYPTVPEIALQWSSEGSYVWIIREGKAQKIITQVISRTAGRVLLEADISDGEPVVVEGLERLEQGMRVKILGSDKQQSEKQVRE
jgi:membrane fusion protein, multidrug efflux system